MEDSPPKQETEQYPQDQPLGGAPEGQQAEQNAANEHAADGCKLLIGNIPYNTTEKDIINLFEKYGEVVTVKIPRRRGKSKGLAIITTKTPEEATAMKNALDQKPIVDVTGRERKMYISFGSDTPPPSKTPRTQDYRTDRRPYDLPPRDQYYESRRYEDDYRRDDYRRDDYRRDDYRRDDYRRDDYRRDDYRRDPYRRDDYRRDDYRFEDSEDDYSRRRRRFDDSEDDDYARRKYRDYDDYSRRRREDDDYDMMRRP